MNARQFLATSVLITSGAYAYETPVHAFITQQGFVRSELANASGELYLRLGFNRFDVEAPFRYPGAGCGTNSNVVQGLDYVDAMPDWLQTSSAPNRSNLRFRCIQNYERRAMPVDYSGRRNTSNGLGNTPEQRFEAWLMRGAIREDDLAAVYYGDSADRPDVDPWLERTRVFNHFYSPVENAHGDLGLATAGQPSLFWAMGETDPFAVAATPNPMRGNHFSYVDARKAFFLALTYKQPFTNATLLEDNAYEDALTRSTLWASSLKNLGHVAHLLQDQASPQHSRGERHNHTCKGYEAAFNQDEATRTYENFTNFRYVSVLNRSTRPDPYTATNDCEEEKWMSMFAEAGQFEDEQSITAWTPTTAYPVPKFAEAHRFFTTRASSDPTDPDDIPLAQLDQRAGLGDYANRGFFTQDKGPGQYQSPPPDLRSPFYVRTAEGPIVVPGFGTVKIRQLLWKVPDAANPGFVDPGGDLFGKTPIASTSFLCEVGDLGTLVACYTRPILTLSNYNQMADMLIPRAIAYTAGLIDFFFRGKLEVTAIDQRLVAVVNQGEPHTVTAEGYPIKPNGQIFGFEKIRVKVRNITSSITESGSGRVVEQTATNGRLLAVARYHRNACYKRDLSGERQRRFAAPPALIVNEPSCNGSPTRTVHQEISVSAPMMITDVSMLPAGTPLEKIFDFSADPIPINATDLFIQIVYRGTLGEEADGIAVGTLDVREPSFLSAWNNTDYAFTEGANIWSAAGPLLPSRFIQSVNVCAGFPSKWIYNYPLTAASGLVFPTALNPQTGLLRLALIQSIPTTGSVPHRIYPIASPSPSPVIRTGNYTGMQRQATREFYALSGANQLPVPSNCTLNPPAANSNVWCNDPVQFRRGRHMGEPAYPLYYTSGLNLTSPPDVDAPPALPAFTGESLLEGGTIRFNDTMLADCPAPPSAISADQMEQILMDEARSLTD
jgi:hypothetical protein